MIREYSSERVETASLGCHFRATTNPIVTSRLTGRLDHVICDRIDVS